MDKVLLQQSSGNLKPPGLSQTAYWSADNSAIQRSFAREIGCFILWCH